MNKIMLITGATSGIGLACAHIFAKNKYNLIISGRRSDRLKKIATELQRNYKVEVLSLSFDIRNRKATEKAFETLPDNWKKIEILVNNAGLAAGLNPLQEGSVDDWEQMIDTNVKGLLYVSRFVAPLMVANNKGHIINVGSIAGKEVYPSGNVYCGTKHAVDALTKGMRMDLVQHGIKVTQIAPGAVETEFSIVRFKGDNERAQKVYQGFKPLLPADVAEVIFYATQLPAHVNINDLVIMPTAQASATVIHKA
jgi:NADP-dependent 3-hydroxy acid dehydrogenase YdfG